MMVPPTAPICTLRASVSTVLSPLVSVVVEERCRRRGLMARGGATRACARWPRRAARRSMVVGMMEMYRIAAAALDAVGLREQLRGASCAIS